MTKNFETHGGVCLVDNELWYQISCSNEVARWIRTQNKDAWWEGCSVRYRFMFDIDEKIYLMIGMQWS
jgi:hypothetical protein